MFDSIIFGEKLRYCRKGLGLGLTKFSAQVETSYQYIGDIERGKGCPSTKLVIQVLNVLGVSYSQLMDLHQYDKKIFYKNIILDKIVGFNVDEKKILLNTIEDMKILFLDEKNLD